jgi:hypothetical protein
MIAHLVECDEDIASVLVLDISVKSYEHALITAFAILFTDSIVYGGFIVLIGDTECHAFAVRVIVSPEQGDFACMLEDIEYIFIADSSTIIEIFSAKFGEHAGNRLGSGGITGVEYGKVHNPVCFELWCGLFAVAVEPPVVSPRGFTHDHDDQFGLGTFFDLGIIADRLEDDRWGKVVLFEIFHSTVYPVAGIGSVSQRFVLSDEGGIVLTEEKQYSCYE